MDQLTFHFIWKHQQQKLSISCILFPFCFIRCNVHWPYSIRNWNWWIF